MKLLYFLVYLLPTILGVVVIYLAVCMIKKRKKGMAVSAAAAALIAAVLALYYLPGSNITAGCHFDFIDVRSGGMQDMVKVTGQENINKLLEVINRHTFVRSAVRTVEDERFPANDLTELTMHDTQSGRLLRVYVFNEHTEKDMLQIDGQVYNVKDKEGLSRDTVNVLKELNIMPE